MLSHLAVFALLAAAEPSLTPKLAIMLGFVAGVLKCVQLATRPRTHAGAAIALALVLLAAVGGHALGLVQRPLDALPPQARVAVNAGAMLLIFLLLVVGVLTGLVSLLHLARARGAYDQGARQAMAAVLVGLLLGVLVSLAFRQGYKDGPSVVPEHLRQPGPVQESFRFQALNFSYRPPEQWAQMKAGQINPVASLVFTRVRPQMFFMIIAEDVGTVGQTTEALAEVAKANLASGTASAKVISETAQRVAGLDGLLIESRASVGGNEFCYWNWVHARGGFLYQLVAWTLVTHLDGERARREVLRAFEGFELLDPTATSKQVTPAEAFTSQHGYRAPARPLPWARLPEADWPEVELLLQREVGSFVAVVPLSLPGRTPSLQDLAAVWAELTERSYPGAPLDAPRPVRLGALDGWEFTFSDVVDGLSYDYRVLVLRAEGRALFLQAWSSDPQRAARTETLAFLDDVVVEPAADPVPFEAMRPIERVTHARALRVLGERAMERSKPEEAAAHYRRACEASPDDPVLLQRHLRALSYAEDLEQAAAVLAAAPAALRADRELLAWGGFLHARLDDDEQAALDYAAALSAGHRDVNDLTDYTEVLWRLGRADGALAVVERFVAAEPDLAAQLLLARLHRRAERPDAAIEVLEPLAEEGLTQAVAHALVEAYLDARRYQPALELCARLQTFELEDAETFFLRGRVQLALERYRDARVSLEEALRRRHPRTDDVQRLLDHVAAALGEGSRASVSTPIAPVPPPPGWSEATELPPGAREAGVCYLARLKAVRFVRGEEHTTTDYYRVRVLDEARVADFGSFVFGFDPLSEAMFVNSVRVLDAHGKVVATGDLASQYVLDDTSQSAPSQQKALHVPVPGVTAGRTIEVVVSRRDLRPDDTFGFLRWCLSLGYPVGLSGVEVTGDTAGLKVVAEHGAAVQRVDKKGLRCLLRAPQVYRGEPYGAHHLTYLPTVVIGDEGRTWEQVGREYLARIDGPLAPDAAAGALAATLVDDVAEPQRLAALAAAVQARLTYRAVAFGLRGTVPRTVPEVLASADGDCKEYALLLHQLLRDQGIASALALVSVNSPVESRVPSLDQFDHMIVVVTGPGGDLFIDPTDKGYVLGQGVPLGLGGGHALVLEERPRLVRIPAYPPGSASLVVSRTVTPAGDLDLAVVERDRFEGYSAAWLRLDLRALAETEHVQWAQRELARFHDAVRVTSVVVTGLADVAAPLVVELRYTLPGALQRVDGRRVGRLPVAWESRYLNVPDQPSRVSPFEVQYPLTVQSTLRLRGDDVRLDGQPGESPGPYFSYRSRAATADGEVTVTFAARRGSIGPEPPARYAACQDASRAALGALRLPFSCR